MPRLHDIRSDTITTATLGLSTRFPEARTAPQAAPKRGLFARFYAALLEGRMRAAMREIAMHRHLIPETIVESAGYQTTVTKNGTLPFNR